MIDLLFNDILGYKTKANYSTLLLFSFFIVSVCFFYRQLKNLRSAPLPWKRALTSAGRNRDSEMWAALGKWSGIRAETGTN